MSPFDPVQKKGYDQGFFRLAYTQACVLIIPFLGSISRGHIALFLFSSVNRRWEEWLEEFLPGAVEYIPEGTRRGSPGGPHDWS